MKIQTDQYTTIYYGMATLFGILAYQMNPWFTVAIISIVIRGVFHEPVHWIMARIMGIPVLNMINTRREAYIEIPGEKTEYGYVALAGFVFDMVIAVVFCIAMSQIGALPGLASVLWLLFMLLISSDPDGDLGMFWKLTGKRYFEKPRKTDIIK